MAGLDTNQKIETSVIQINSGEHTVLKNENLYTIKTKYETTYDILNSLNPNFETILLRKGFKIDGDIIYRNGNPIMVIDIKIGDTIRVPINISNIEVVNKDTRPNEKQKILPTIITPAQESEASKSCITNWTDIKGNVFKRQNDFNELIINASQANGIDCLIFKSLLAQESGFNPKACNMGGFAGIAQMGLSAYCDTKNKEEKNKESYCVKDDKKYVMDAIKEPFNNEIYNTNINNGNIVGLNFKISNEKATNKQMIIFNSSDPRFDEKIAIMASAKYLRKIINQIDRYILTRYKKLTLTSSDKYKFYTAGYNAGVNFVFLTYCVYCLLKENQDLTFIIEKKLITELKNLYANIGSPIYEILWESLVEERFEQYNNQTALEIAIYIQAYGVGKRTEIPEYAQNIILRAYQ